MVSGARQQWGGALALGLGLLLPLGCAGDYPLPPTRCDDWCNVTQGLDSCGIDYDPAGCVVACESQGLGADACDWAFAPAMTCFQQHPNAAAQLCFYDPLFPPPCQLEVQQLWSCAGIYSGFQPQE